MLRVFLVQRMIQGIYTRCKTHTTPTAACSTAPCSIRQLSRMSQMTNLANQYAHVNSLDSTLSHAVGNPVKSCPPICLETRLAVIRQMVKSFQSSKAFSYHAKTTDGHRASIVCGFSRMKQYKHSSESGSGHYWLINNSSVFLVSHRHIQLFSNRQHGSQASWKTYTVEYTPDFLPTLAKRSLGNKAWMQSNHSERHNFDTAHFLYLTQAFENVVHCNFAWPLCINVAKFIRAED